MMLVIVQLEAEVEEVTNAIICMINLSPTKTIYNLYLHLKPRSLK